jgi:hypothetical protein
MNKKPLNEIFNAAKLSMTESEKKSTWDGVLRRSSDFPDGISPYANKESTWDGVLRRESDFPVRIPVLSRLYYRGALPTLQKSISFSRKRKYALSILAGSLVLSGGISAFAQGALPGDLLYPVKIYVNEQVQSSLAFTPLGKVNVESALATERLLEVEKLAVQGKLNPAVEQKLGEAFTSHVQKFRKNLTDLEATNQVDASALATAYFTSRLAAHTIVLNDLAEKIQTASSEQENNQKEQTVQLSMKTKIAFSENKMASSSLLFTALLADSVFDKLVATTTQPTPSMTGKYKRMFNRQNAKAVEYLRTLRQDVGLPETDTADTATNQSVVEEVIDAKRSSQVEATTSSASQSTISAIEATSSAILNAGTDR